MKLILGLGNPEARYDGTRHNTGFYMLDDIARRADATFQQHSKFKATIAKAAIGEQQVLLAKPATYYNLVGDSARAMMDFYKLAPQDILVVHDDLSLDFGTLRTRIGGSDAGNNGLKSLAAHVGPDTARIRIGIANPLRTRTGDADFVLGKFNPTEQATLEELATIVYSIVETFTSRQLAITTHRIADKSDTSSSRDT